MKRFIYLLSISMLVVGCQEPLATKTEPAAPAEKVADIIVDDADPGFLTEGDAAWEPSWTGQDYMGGLLWSMASSTATAKAIFTPEIKAAGTYEVYEWHGGDPNYDRASNTPHIINYDGGSKTVTVNQQENIGKWNLLGAFKFAAGTKGTIVITNQTNGNPVADAIKLVYKSS